MNFVVENTVPEKCLFLQIFVALGTFYIARNFGNFSMLSMNFYIDIKSMSGNKIKFYTRKLISVFIEANASLTTLSHTGHIHAINSSSLFRN